MAAKTETKSRHIRGIATNVDRVLRIEAAKEGISVNQLIVNILSDYAKGKEG